MTSSQLFGQEMSSVGENALGTRGEWFRSPLQGAPTMDRAPKNEDAADAVLVLPFQVPASDVRVSPAHSTPAPPAGCVALDWEHRR